MAIEEARKFCDETNLKAEAELLDFFREQGMIIIEPDKEAFIAYAENFYSTGTESKDILKDWDMDLYEELQALKWQIECLNNFIGIE